MKEAIPRLQHFTKDLKALITNTASKDLIDYVLQDNSGRINPAPPVPVFDVPQHFKAKSLHCPKSPFGVVSPS